MKKPCTQQCQTCVLMKHTKSVASGRLIEGMANVTIYANIYRLMPSKILAISDIS